MASRNFHKRRTKERKQRQFVERTAAHRFGWREREKYAPDLLMAGPTLAAAAAGLLLSRGARRP